MILKKTRANNLLETILIKNYKKILLHDNKILQMHAEKE